MESVYAGYQVYILGGEILKMCVRNSTPHYFTKASATGYLPPWARIEKFFSQEIVLREKYADLFYISELQKIEISPNFHPTGKHINQ